MVFQMNGPCDELDIGCFPSLVFFSPCCGARLQPAPALSVDVPNLALFNLVSEPRNAMCHTIGDVESVEGLASPGRSVDHAHCGPLQNILDEILFVWKRVYVVFSESDNDFLAILASPETSICLFFTPWDPDKRTPVLQILILVGQCVIGSGEVFLIAIHARGSQGLGYFRIVARKGIDIFYGWHRAVC